MLLQLEMPLRSSVTGLETQSPRMKEISGFVADAKILTAKEIKTRKRANELLTIKHS